MKYQRGEREDVLRATTKKKKEVNKLKQIAKGMRTKEWKGVGRTQQKRNQIRRAESKRESGKTKNENEHSITQQRWWLSGVYSYSEMFTRGDPLNADVSVRFVAIFVSTTVHATHGSREGDENTFYPYFEFAMQQAVRIAVGPHNSCECERKLCTVSL